MCVLYTKRPHTSRGKQTLNISVRTLLHKTAGTEKKDNHTRVLALAARALRREPAPRYTRVYASARAATYVRTQPDAARCGKRVLQELFFETRNAKRGKNYARRTNEVRVAAFSLFRAYGLAATKDRERSRGLPGNEAGRNGKRDSWRKRKRTSELAERERKEKERRIACPVRVRDPLYVAALASVSVHTVVNLECLPCTSSKY